MKRIWMSFLLFVLLLHMLASAACGGGDTPPTELPPPSGDTTEETVEVTAPGVFEILLGERVYYLENVSARGKQGENLTHLLTVTVSDGVRLDKGYYEFEKAGTYLVTYTLELDGEAYTAETRIRVKA